MSDSWDHGKSTTTLVIHGVLDVTVRSGVLGYCSDQQRKSLPWIVGMLDVRKGCYSNVLRIAFDVWG